MDRKSFIARLIAVPAALLGIKAIAKEEEGTPMFNIERIQERLDYLRKYPRTYDECFYPIRFDLKRTVKAPKGWHSVSIGGKTYHFVKDQLIAVE